MTCAVRRFTLDAKLTSFKRLGSSVVTDNRALAAASKQASQDKIPLIVLFLLSPQDYVAHDRSKRRIDFVLRNLSEIKVMI